MLRWRYGLLGVGLLATTVLIVLTKNNPSHVANGHVLHAQTTLVDQSALNLLPTRSVSSADVSHVAPNLLPPTNTWFSGMVLQTTPQPVFPMPLSFLGKPGGYELGLPSISSTATQISGSHAPGLILTNNADSFKLTGYDKLSATITYAKSGQPIGSATITEGSPFVFYVASASQQITIPNVKLADVLERNDHYVRYRRGAVSYVVTSKASKITATESGLTLQSEKGNLITTYALPDTTDSLRSYADNRIESVSVDHNLTAAIASTQFKVTTSNKKPTVLAMMPYSTVQGTVLTNYASIWGTMKVYSGSTFTTSATRIAPASELDVRTLSLDQKQQIINSLQADVATTTIDAQDSYYAGKQLARAANLLSLAEQLGQAETAKQLVAKLSKAFSVRLHTDFFYYDTTLKGVAATKAAFGSEDFNDHHFHYGYWLYAGSILGKYDSTFLKQNAPQLSLLAADIANPGATNQFPAYRNYDPYAGHSWAAGLSPFSDGNNQESSSEAIHAWNGVAAWGKVTKNAELQQTGEWLLANEASTGQRAWRSVDTTNQALSNFTSPVASLNFGGKRTYSTFFSDQAAAKQGIQLIPMDPSMQTFRSDKDIITTSVSKTVPNNNFNVPLGDYVLMYLSLADPTKAKQLIGQQTLIDDGNSMSYLKAFIFLQK